MVAAAQRRSEIERIQLRVVKGQAEHLPFNNDSFDYVLAVTVLCFVRDAERAVAEMARVLKPGGYLVIGELGQSSLWAMHRRVRLARQSDLEDGKIPHGEWASTDWSRPPALRWSKCVARCITHHAR
jgi:ubiquinone/menaquinone biosynthesis C-methylase UbiE